MRKIAYKLLFLWLLTPSALLAQEGGGTPTPTPTGPEAGSAAKAPRLDDLTALIRAGGPLYDFMVALGYSLAIAGIVYAGLIYFLPGSSEDKPARSKAAIIAVASGLAVIVLAKIIISIAGADELIAPVTPE